MGGMGCVQPFRTTRWGREVEECSAWLRLVHTFQDKQPEWDTRQEQRQRGIEGSTRWLARARVAAREGQEGQTSFAARERLGEPMLWHFG